MLKQQDIATNTVCNQCSINVIITDSASLWYFAARRGAKGMAIACEERLAVNVDKLTELAIITLIEH